jgi:chromosome segregation ATPase
MVEDAVGLGRYRSNIMEAQEKLEQALSEKESVKSLLVNAEQTLDYWKAE